MKKVVARNYGYYG